MAEPSKKSRKRGKTKPPHKATPRTREAVRAMLAARMTQEAIAATLGIGRIVLRRVYAEEIAQAGNRDGQRAHVPTEEMRRQVESMAGYGIPKEDIAAVTGVSKSVIERHYATELAQGHIKANSRVAQSLFQQATGAPAQVGPDGHVLRDEVKPNVTAAIFWTKARMGWRETTRQEHTGKDGGPIEMELSRLSDDELRTLENILGKTAQPGDGSGGDTPTRH